MIKTITFWLLLDPSGAIFDEFEGGMAGLDACHAAQMEAFEVIPYEDEWLGCHGYGDGFQVRILPDVVIPD